MHEILLNLGWCKTIFDGIYIKYTPQGKIDGILLLWVDDLLIASGVTKAKQLLLQIHAHINLKMNGTPRHFLGMDVHVSSDGIFLSQSTYAKSLPVHIDNLSKPISNPLPTLASAP